MSESSEETALTFPCQFPVKLMGHNKPEFRPLAIRLIEQHTGKVAADTVKESQSRNGNFLSITVTIDAKNQQQLDDIYRTLSNHKEVLVAL